LFLVIQVYFLQKKKWITFEYELNSFNELSDSNLTSKEQKQCVYFDNHLQKHKDIGILVLETICSKTMKTLSRAMYAEIRKLCKLHKVALIVDDGMASMRCGHLFSFMYFPEVEPPDFVLVGKQWQFAYLFSINEIDDCYKHINGIFTTYIDSAVIQRTVRLLEYVMENSCIENSRAIGSHLELHLRQEAKRVGLLKKAVIRGSSAMWFCDLKFEDCPSTINLMHDRLLPAIDSDLMELTAELTALGKIRSSN
jgi:4-aminobutyrate aminotransferase-like enzyme